ncbi:dihydrolipoyllysine-residue succinyltransferase component of 2-oxoglutarate dehydrogenase complex, mitochondrial [Cyclospora cayetanensis]|uniref:dihydrolipoyllysine-residue succinyltransferase n=1 Tax=Cyclospora cayetanensis TaxID=88456 RepID=A0A6P6RWD3_9EIME|nr:dihydrolipoyllysine-residue succinyltransferase component of 2-oxoglutarate dehydrogenase complex, mitochondrial [Cyclospora cayetanensis]
MSVCLQKRQQLPAAAARPAVYLHGFLSTKRLFHAAAAGTYKVVECPLMGDSITEGTLQEWKYNVGSYVPEGALLAVVETDKVAVEINAAAAGKLAEVHAQPGETVFVGKPLYAIDTTSAAPAADENGKPNSDAPPSAASSTPPEPLAAMKSFPATPPAAASAAPAAASYGQPSSTPAAREGAPALDTPVPDLQPLQQGLNRVERRVPMSRLRQRVAVRLKDAQNTAAMLTTFNECDMGALMALRNELNGEFQEKHGVKMGFVSAFMLASALSLKKYPAVNAVIQGKDVIYKEYVDISVAVAAPSGLLVPVVRDCQAKAWPQLEQELVVLAKKARNNQIALEDMAGGTFTISNGGVYGSMMGTPIINPPQSAILGMHGVTQRPVVRDNQIVIRPIMYLALTYDHRLIDGREAVLFLCSIRDYIQDPRRMLLGL